MEKKKQLNYAMVLASQNEPRDGRSWLLWFCVVAFCVCVSGGSVCSIFPF